MARQTSDKMIAEIVKYISINSVIILMNHSYVMALQQLFHGDKHVSVNMVNQLLMTISL